MRLLRTRPVGRPSWAMPDDPLADAPAVGLDEATFARLYPALRRFAAVVSPREVDPDDVVQEALARCLRRLERGPIERVDRYVRRIVLNLELSRRRTAGRRRVVDPLLAAAAETRDAYPSDLDPLKGMDPTDRAVLYLTAIEGMTFAEVAEVLGLAEASLRVRASRARRRLRADMEGVDRHG